uniref:E-selectin n=1 Tax=Cyprinodon variegatus TaxID=28743 RepID=A0A3Q2C8Z2_CYPVA
MNWTEARKWCQTHFTDLVVIQSDKENAYIASLLPTKDSSPYYWIGITKKQINETWSWVGNNSTWVGNTSWAENEPNNNLSAEFCVEMYVNSRNNHGKWNDEKCANKKYAVCYKAQCNQTSCVNGMCWETINSTTCLCYPGYEGDKCQTGVECPPLSAPENGDFNCSGGVTHKFNTTCHFKCHPGFIINGSSDVTCETNRIWSDPQPVSVKCPPLSQPANGSHSCSTESQIFNSTCHFKCHLGFFMIGSSTVTCAANGDWTGPRPICESNCLQFKYFAVLEISIRKKNDFILEAMYLPRRGSHFTIWLAGSKQEFEISATVSCS